MSRHDPRRLSLLELVQQGKDKEFIAGAQWYIGPNGLLVAAPFNIDPNKLK